MMSLSALALSLSLLLEADAPNGGRPPPPPPLPRSSIAAVLAHRGVLGLDDAEVRHLEERDAALQRQVEGLRRRADAPPEHGGRRAEGPAPGEARGTQGAQSPSSAALPEGFGGRGGHNGGGRGGRQAGGDRAPARASVASVAALQTQLDDADTAAWLAAEALLREEKREAARAVAEQYREELADRREADRRNR